MRLFRGVAIAAFLFLLCPRPLPAQTTGQTGASSAPVNAPASPSSTVPQSAQPQPPPSNSPQQSTGVPVHPAPMPTQSAPGQPNQSASPQTAGGANQQSPGPAMIEASVIDENGLAVPDATVRIRGGTVLLKLQTDDAGHFKAGPLPAGDYHVDIEKQAFFRLTDQPLALVAGVNQVSYTIAHEQELHQKVEVVSTANDIQPELTEHRDTIVQHEIRDLPFPVSHDLRTALPALPSVVLDNNAQIHVAGSRSDETEYLLDGFEISDAATGGLHSNLNIDAVRSVNVESGRYGAQYANAGAGVMALETQQGDDQWRFGTTNFLPGPVWYKGVHFGNYYPRFTLAGPIRRGHAWFSDALTLAHTLTIIKELPPGQDTSNTWHSDNLMRAQVNLTPRQALQGNFLANVDHDSHLGIGVFTPISTTTDLGSRFFFFSGKDQLTFGSNLLEFGLAGDSTRLHRYPLGNALYVLTPNGATGNYFEDLHENTHRWQAIGNLFLPSREWMGTHDFAFGTNFAWIRYSQTANRGPFNIVNLSGSVIQRTSFGGNPQLGESTFQSGVYGQDAWNLTPRIRIEPGLRVDWDRIVRRPLPGPRVMLNVLPFPGDWAKLSAGWGIYYQPVNLFSLGEALDQTRTDTIYDSSGTVILGPVQTQFTAPAYGLKAPRFYTASLGWQEQIGLNTLASIQVLRRVERDGLAYENLLPPVCNNGGCLSPGALFLLQNNRSDHYKAVEFSVRHSIHDQAAFFADYTRSRASTNEALDYALAATVFSPQAAGALPWDAPNRLISWAYAPSHIWDILASYFLEYRTGYPFGVVNAQHELIGPPDSMRFPDYVSLNLAFEKRVPFHGHMWAVRLAVINVADHFNPMAVNNNINSPYYLEFTSSEGRAFTGRIRLVTK